MVSIITLIRDQVIIFVLRQLVSEPSFDPRSSYFYLFQVLDSRSERKLFVQFGTVHCVTKFTNPTTFDLFHYSFYSMTLLGLLSDRSIALTQKLDTAATSINSVASTRIEIDASSRIETTTLEVATTSFDLYDYYFAVIRDNHRSF